MPKIVLATCRAWPEPASDASLRVALAELGHEVASIPWDEDFYTMSDADLIVLRSCWDYFEAPDAFLAWLDNLARNDKNTLNPISTLRWNFDKRYLLQLAEAGIDVIPTVLTGPENDQAKKIMETQNWPDAVRKPIHGQSGEGVQKLSLSGDWPAAPGEGPFLLQQFQRDISDLGETMLVFFEGEFSHALRRELPAGEWRSNSQYGSKRVIAGVSDEIVARAKNVLDQAVAAGSLCDMPVYARVDGIIRQDKFMLMELELIEPALGFELAPEAARRFADCLVKRC